MEKHDVRYRVSSIVNRLAPLTPKSQADQRLALADGQSAIPIDSVVVLQLVLAIEDEFGVTFEDGDIGPENFSDIASLCRFVETKLAQL